MKSYPVISLVLSIALAPFLFSQDLSPEDFRVTYGEGNGGKHIVFIAGEREYRSEESLPALARILAKHHGFRCTVLFTLADDGSIEPQGPNLKGLEILYEADLLFMFMRFLNLPDEEMNYFDAFVESGKPLIGLRTSTHAFRIPDGPWQKYDSTYSEKEFVGGFGRQILGETWVAHHGDNHVQGTRLVPLEHRSEHPVLRGVGEMFVMTGGYLTSPREGSWPLVMTQPLMEMNADAEPHPALHAVPAVWTRTRDVGERGRVLACMHGSSLDLLDSDFRRMLVNACFWALELDDQITDDLNISFVGPFEPTLFASYAWKRGVAPSDLEGYTSLIMPGKSPIAPDSFLKRLEVRKSKWKALETGEP